MTRVKLTAISILAVFSILTFAWPAPAQDQRVLVTVNDLPITNFDIDVRINLWKLLGLSTKRANIRKDALNAIIDDVAKIEEAKKYRAEATEKDIEQRLDRVAKGLKTDSNGLQAKLKEQGISMTALRQYVSAQFAFNRLIIGKYKEKVEVTSAEVDQKMEEIKADINGQINKIKSDPRMKPITVYELMEITFPVDSEEMLQSRFVEAAQFAGKFKGCKSARAAASGIFNVKLGKVIEADGRKVPAQMKTAFSKVGPGKAVGPFRSQKGIQLWGFCGTRKISPQLPKATLPSRDQVQNIIVNEKYDALEKKYGQLFRKNLLIEYRDPTYAE